jgi:hypothetical protein
MSRRTMQGKMIDMDKLISQNELMPAIGNMKVNARGDELGPGGKIIRKREDIVAAYYEDNPAAQPAPRQAKPVAQQPTPPQPILEDGEEFIPNNKLSQEIK